MAAQICIKMACGTFFQLVKKANRFLPFFYKLDTRHQLEIYLRGCTGTLFFTTRLKGLSKPHRKIIRIIANNRRNNVKHKKLNKHKIESEMQFNMTLYYRQCSINETFGGHFVVVFFVV